MDLYPPEASHRIKKGRRAIFWVLSGLAVVIVAVVLLVGNPFPGTSVPPAAPVYPPGTQRVSLRLYFASADGLFLVPQARTVLQPPALPDQMAVALHELISGPEGEGLARVVPAETTLRQVFVTDQGTAYVNFGPEIATKHPGGIGAEILSVYGVVDTLERNFPQVKEVAILIDGREVPTLAGHVDISRPLTPRADIIMDRPPAAAGQQKG